MADDDVVSIPNVALIDFDAVLQTQFAEFILICLVLVAIRLLFDILDNTVEERLANGKRAVSRLPCEEWSAVSGTLCPFRCLGFHVFDELGDSDRPGQPTNDVDVIDPATCASRKTSCFLNVVAEHSEHFFPKF